MRSGSGRIDRAAEYLAGFVLSVAAAGLVVMTVVIAWQVFARYVLNDSPPWSEAAALVIMLYFVLLGAAVGVHEGFHLGFRLFVSMLALRAKTAVFALGQLLIMAFGATMAWNGMALVDYTASHVIPTLGVARSVAYWPFVICGVLIVLFALVNCVALVRGKGGVDPWS